MLITTALLAAIVVAVVGGLILWSNPARKTNWAVSNCSLHITAWLACLHVAIAVPPDDGLIWLRWSCAIGGLVPLSFWIVKESIVTSLSDFDYRWVLRHSGWVVASIILVAIPFTNIFIPVQSTPTNRIYGWGYYCYMWSLLGLYGYMFFDAFRSSRTLVGARRLELQIWLGGGCAMVCSVIITMALNALTGNRLFIRIQPLLVLVFYGGIAFAITTHRIFNARQILLVGLQKIALVSSVAGAAYLLDRGFGFFLSEPFALFITTAFVLWFAATLNGWLDRVFQFYPQATVARQAAFAAARNELRVEKLETSFLAVLEGWGQSDYSLILSGTRESLRGGGLEVSGDCIIVKVLRQLRWVTPERLAREKPTSEREELGAFLIKHGLGALVISEGPALTVIVGVGIAASRRPFTYPQVTQLMELASIIESALERAHFSVKAQHAEQLATVGLLGASLAHEIRNPLVSIKTFVQLLPKHHHDPLFRDKFFRLIGEEVARIDRLTEQLLDLATPRSYAAEPVHLHPVLRETLDLAAAKASDKQIEFMTDFRAVPDVALTDSSAAKQVLLNLCFNAIQAMDERDGQKWVRVATRKLSNGIEMTVSDNGPGIATEMLSRIFQPFQSTKSTGFGLGLAICSDILSGLKATIVVDPPCPGSGATFRITFPCPPPSS